MTADAQWLASLQKGDEVALVDYQRLASVARATPTQIVVLLNGRELRYRRRDGRCVGGRHSDRIVQVTGAIRQEVRHHELRQWARWHAEQELRALDPESIGQVRALIAQLRKDKQT